MQAYVATTSFILDDLTNCMKFGIPYTAQNNTTLNEKFQVATSDKHPIDKYPELQYFAIGIGGSNVVYNGYMLSTHISLHAALYNHVPFITRPLSQDLTLEERAKYRMRVEVEYNNVQYAEYYLKVIPNSKQYDPVTQVNKNGDESSIVDFDYNSSEILNPTIQRTSPIADSSEAIAVRKVVDFSLSTFDINEIKNSLSLKGITDFNLTEIGICSGYDKTIDGFKEAVSTQVGIFVPISYDLQGELPNGISKNIEVGSMQLKSI